MYNGISYGPQPLPPMAQSTAWAPTPPYMGDYVADRTSMTPFDAGSYVPVYNEGPKDATLQFGPGSPLGPSPSPLGGAAGWLSNVVSAVTGAVGQIPTGLREGSRGAGVGVLQHALQRLGYSSTTRGPLGRDNDFGPITAEALGNFQTSKGLSKTLTTDAPTVEALNRSLTLLKGLEYGQQLPQLPSQGLVGESPAVQPGLEPPPKKGIPWGWIAAAAATMGVIYIAVKD